MNTKELIETYPGLSDEARRHLLKAVSTRGKSKGYLLASQPSCYKQPDKFVAWTCLVGNLAPARISVFSVAFAPENVANSYKALDKEVTECAGFTFALNAVEPAFRWNLWAHRYDQAKAIDFIKEYITKGVSNNA